MNIARKQEILRIVIIYVKVLFFWFCLISSTHGMSYKVDRSFKLVFWDIEIGRLDVKAEINDSRYVVSSLGSAKGIISFFSKIVISAGAVGIVNGSGDLIPSESSTKWHSYGKSKHTRLEYMNRKLAYFFNSPGLKRSYHISNPIGLEETIDPVSLMLWFLMRHNQNQLCQGELNVLDGFRMSKLKIFNRINNGGSVICQGVLRRVSGFREVEFKKAPLNFKIFYVNRLERGFFLTKLEIETIFGKIKVVEDSKSK